MSKIWQFPTRNEIFWEKANCFFRQDSQAEWLSYQYPVTFTIFSPSYWWSHLSSHSQASLIPLWTEEHHMNGSLWSESGVSTLPVFSHKSDCSGLFTCRCFPHLRILTLCIWQVSPFMSHAVCPGGVAHNHDLITVLMSMNRVRFP